MENEQLKHVFVLFNGDVFKQKKKEYDKLEKLLLVEIFFFMF